MYYARICGAFITFENDKELNTAVKMLKEQHHHFKVDRAQEPSNYIWENLGFTEKQQNQRYKLAILILTFCMFLSYKWQFAM